MSLDLDMSGRPASFARQGSVRGLLLPQRLALFAVVALACCLGTLTRLLQGQAALLLALAAIAVAMWHGAYDQVQAEQVLARRLGRHWLPLFLAGYAALAAVTFAGWQLVPFASLTLFLFYSAWHFGTEAEQHTPAPAAALVALALGAAPIVAACWFHPSEVWPIFAQMLGGEGQAEARARLLTHALGLSCWPVLAAAALGILTGQAGRDAAQKWELAAVLLLEIALFAVCEPLIAFAVYFCCWHTPEHLMATSLPPASLATNLKTGFVPWLLSLALLGAVFVLGRHQAAAYRAEIFVVLSALTVPHMALNELRRASNLPSYHADCDEP
jgi:Brp/Blh family beta-carotene 15,15'-monooxygenase